MVGYDKVFSTLVRFAKEYNLDIQIRCCGEGQLILVMTHNTYRVERKVDLDILDAGGSDRLEPIINDMARSLYLRSVKNIVMQVSNVVDDTCKIVENISNYAGITSEKLDILKNLYEIKKILGYDEEEL